MERPRVLVVDDSGSILRLFARLLAADCDLATAADGASALALVASRTFDVVVTDLDLPSGSGLDVLRAARKRSAGTEVVMTTGDATRPEVAEALSEGAFGWLQKPFDPDAAVRLVFRALERKRLIEIAAGLRREIEEAR